MKSIVKDRRIGRFRVDVRDVEQRCELLRGLFAETVIVSCSMKFESNCFEYVAFSRLFSPSPLGEEPPLYDVKVMDDGVHLSLPKRS